ASNFPGVIARFRSGAATVIVRRVTAAARPLHPAADCFPAAGYSLGAGRPYTHPRQARWDCFGAPPDRPRPRVFAGIHDQARDQGTDVSSWYWSALWAQRNRNAGPWWAVTLVAPLNGEDDS